jgi:hypothetical protein
MSHLLTLGCAVGQCRIREQAHRRGSAASSGAVAGASEAWLPTFAGFAAARQRGNPWNKSSRR